MTRLYGTWLGRHVKKHRRKREEKARRRERRQLRTKRTEQLPRMEQQQAPLGTTIDEEMQSDSNAGLGTVSLCDTISFPETNMAREQSGSMEHDQQSIKLDENLDSNPRGGDESVSTKDTDGKPSVLVQQADQEHSMNYVNDAASCSQPSGLSMRGTSPEQEHTIEELEKRSSEHQQAADEEMGEPSAEAETDQAVALEGALGLELAH
ncbi:hypothetical protein MPDQ_005185 [Monascus purpureus]|uniref:Uncharacterized protein n=1 Tax=Monascus purpureus TaxID=5098 RepID=A0A507QKV3_MONPU|nr:hypothetical protein MPDQ_005185 [Monascus purpureus]BDD62128.1 hypothetical protein MAP00_007118 [Monascus purpureus]